MFQYISIIIIIVLGTFCIIGCLFAVTETKNPKTLDYLVCILIILISLYYIGFVCYMLGSLRSRDKNILEGTVVYQEELHINKGDTILLESKTRPVDE